MVNNERAGMRERESDSSLSVYIKDKIMPPLIVAFILGSGAGYFAMFKKLDEAISLSTRNANDVELIKLEMTAQRAEYTGKIAALQGQMVGWDVIKRIELFMQQYATAGKGNEAMKIMAAALKAESEARQGNHK